jgi:hypothetical protein
VETGTYDAQDRVTSYAGATFTYTTERGMSGMCGQAPPREENVSGGVDEYTKTPWILPIGDPVVDYAKCELVE